ncbi:hypothetical protein NDU88_001320 [Pleurodeles waltl]|uniref:Uncharacterized protein n=1 Tax=Pleurodeles waltl TaxID=8319 RepID=A0AAV7UVS6_PLEWA|nr:hypothetical protein NDU88_001320 [Pleurodeles waltl]
MSVCGPRGACSRDFVAHSHPSPTFPESGLPHLRGHEASAEHNRVPGKCNRDSAPAAEDWSPLLRTLLGILILHDRWSGPSEIPHWQQRDHSHACSPTAQSNYKQPSAEKHNRRKDALPACLPLELSRPSGNFLAYQSQAGQTDLREKCLTRQAEHCGGPRPVADVFEDDEPQELDPKEILLDVKTSLKNIDPKLDLLTSHLDQCRRICSYRYVVSARVGSLKRQETPRAGACQAQNDRKKPSARSAAFSDRERDKRPLTVTGRHHTTRSGESLPRGMPRMESEECGGVPRTRHAQKSESLKARSVPRIPKQI